MPPPPPTPPKTLKADAASTLRIKQCQPIKGISGKWLYDFEYLQQNLNTQLLFFK